MCFVAVVTPRHPELPTMLKHLTSWALALCLCAGVAAQTKPRIDKAADLPRFSYPVKGSLETLVRDEAAFAPFAAQLRSDTESVLARYDIADKAMQRQLLGTLLQLDLLEGKDTQALERIATIRALEEKPADKLLSGVQAQAIVEARQAAGGAGSPGYADEVGKRIAQALQGMPYLVVANDLKATKMRAELVGEALVLGQVRDVLQPIVDKAGALSSDLAPGIVNARAALLLRLPLKQTLIDTYGAYLQANQVEKPDIWAARSVTLAPGGAFKPVTVAVWDSGVDSSLFKAQVKRDARGKPLLSAYDKYGKPSRSELQPLPPAVRAKLPQMISRSKGFSDLQSNIDSVEAGEVKRELSTLKPEAYKAAIEEIQLAGNYEHGTHVAGITLDGNPHARLLIARIEFGHTLMPDPCPSLRQARRDAQVSLEQIAFLKKHGARVVNMSWGGSVGDIESALEQCDSGKTPEQRKALARELFTLSRDALQRGFASAPGILWVAAAGNSNVDASFAESAPADIVLPNLLTVGAVDRAGDEAAFTSYGPTVKVHANGYQVESYLPGGTRVALSGTSMAAPQVANLAGKMLVVNPKLKPAELVEIIVATADKTEDGRRTLVNPAKAVEAARLR